MLILVKNILKKIAVAIGVALLFLSLGEASVFYLKARSLDSEIKQAQDMAKKLEEESVQLQAEKEKIVKENEKLQEDEVVYTGINNRLKEEKEKLAAQLGEAWETTDNQAADLELLKKKSVELQEALAKKEKEFKEGGVEKVKELEGKIKVLEKTLKKEKAVFRYNLAVAYTKAKLYDEAIGAYEKSLELDQNNADAHYNLGLLYKDAKQDADKAAAHLSKYLELKPDADDKGKVKEWLEKLK